MVQQPLSVEGRQGSSDCLLSDCTMLPAAYLRVSHEVVMEAADGSVLKDWDQDFIQQHITFAADEEATSCLGPPRLLTESEKF